MRLRKCFLVFLFFALLVFFAKPILAETSFNVVVEPGAVFYLEDYGTEVRVASTLYAEEIVVYGDKVEFKYASFDQVNVLYFTVEPVSCNVTLNEIGEYSFSFTLNASTEGTVKIYFPYDVPEAVKTEGVSVYIYTDYEMFSLANPPTAYYNSTGKYLEIKAGDGTSYWIVFFEKLVKTVVRTVVYEPGLTITWSSGSLEFGYTNDTYVHLLDFPAGWKLIVHDGGITYFYNISSPHMVLDIKQLPREGTIRVSYSEQTNTGEVCLTIHPHFPEAEQVFSLPNTFTWYTTVWGAASYIIIFLVPASIWLAKRSIALASAALALMGASSMVFIPSEVRAVAFAALALGLTGLLYSVFWGKS